MAGRLSMIVVVFASRCEMQKSGVPRCEPRSLIQCMWSVMCVRRRCRARCVAKEVLCTCRGLVEMSDADNVVGIGNEADRRSCRSATRTRAWRRA
eukprot:1758766-Rhodomonas_salina.2